jgi:methyl-accepting chemotaxis protein
METTSLASPEIHIPRKGKKEGFWETNSEIQKKIMVFFVVLILLTSTLGGVAIYHHYKTHHTGERGTTAVSYGKAAANGETNLPAQFGEKIIPFIAIGIVSILIIFMVFFIRKIILPLSKLEKMTREMADGRLDLIVQDNQNASCSIDTISENVNSLAMNLQEILLLIWNHSEHNLGALGKALETLDDESGNPEDVKANLQEIKKELLQMQELTKQFELFDVTLEGNKALAKDDTVNP